MNLNPAVQPKGYCPSLGFQLHENSMPFTTKCVVNSFVFHFGLTVDSLTCNKCNFGLAGLCLSSSSMECANSTYQCFTGKASKLTPKRSQIFPQPDFSTSQPLPNTESQLVIFHLCNVALTQPSLLSFLHLHRGLQHPGLH